MRRIFDFDGHDVTVISYSGQPAWVAQEVERALGCAPDSFVKMIRRHGDEFPEGEYVMRLEGEDLAFLKRSLPVNLTGGRARHLLLLTEPGLYYALMISRAPKAIPFRKWLAQDVVPQLRATGRAELVAGTELVPARLREDLVSSQQAQIRLLEELANARMQMLTMQAETHRLAGEAHKREVEDLRTLSDAYVKSRRPTEVKQADLLEALQDPQLCNLSSRLLAAHLHVSHTHVQNVRREYEVPRGTLLTAARIERIEAARKGTLTVLHGGASKGAPPSAAGPPATPPNGESDEESDGALRSALEKLRFSKREIADAVRATPKGTAPERLAAALRLLRR